MLIKTVKTEISNLLDSNEMMMSNPGNSLHLSKDQSILLRRILLLGLDTSYEQLPSHNSQAQAPTGNWNKMQMKHNEGKFKQMHGSSSPCYSASPSSLISSITATSMKDQLDFNGNQTCPAPLLQPLISQASLQQQRYMSSQYQANPLLQQSSSTYFGNSLSYCPPQQEQDNRIYPSTANTTNTDSINSNCWGVQSSPIYQTKHYAYPDTTIYMQSPSTNVPNTNPVYYHKSPVSISPSPQNNTMVLPSPISGCPSSLFIDHDNDTIRQSQSPPCLPSQEYKNKLITFGQTPQHDTFYQNSSQQPLHISPEPSYGTQISLAYGEYYPE
ncbi:unnamed protein product [Rotaria socialis]|uniref:Uncharacterized protein n=1 Tax=Rotaria socialis TaxID=392032 RepID=A0A820VJH0_9BILA|nr:unnamed protein product [Rotaria socialis]CAF3582016.1 unnamed protein product [Rotaria socialis]CAF3624323.1 unnamed protein product [Rotaria socialis]CAF4184384.1 unnamed protein product [Rotaria socialis]CAF4349523.1 unnamed protein product [Rotaria socialis]